MCGNVCTAYTLNKRRWNLARSGTVPATAMRRNARVAFVLLGSGKRLRRRGNQIRPDADHPIPEKPLGLSLLCMESNLELLAPRAGFEPATIRLTVECSTAELPRNSANQGSATPERITKPLRLAKDEMGRAGVLPAESGFHLCRNGLSAVLTVWNHGSGGPGRERADARRHVLTAKSTQSAAKFDEPDSTR